VPEKFCKKRSGGIVRFSGSKWMSRLKPIGWFTKKPTLIINDEGVELPTA
jgi:hypothetical protein